MNLPENQAPTYETVPDESPRAPSTHVRPKASWRRTVVRLGVSGLTLAALVMILPRGDLWAALRQVPLGAWGKASPST